MKLTIDTDRRTVTRENASDRSEIVDLYSPEAFDLITGVWLKSGWQQKYSYQFTWLGRPIIQLPEDMIRIQEVIWRVAPDVIVETGVAHGGSLIFYASLCKMRGRGRVIGVDVHIRPENRRAIEEHPLTHLATLIEGSSISDDVVAAVKRLVAPEESVLVVLDSCHSRLHVLEELDRYHRLVTRGSYIIATDGIMRELYDVPNGNPAWVNDNPADAAAIFASQHPEFVLEPPAPSFTETNLRRAVTYWPGAWLRRLP